jgi:SAM-dependent methyltransferase
MACFLPNSSFTGIDLAAAGVAEANAAISALHLTNISVCEQDLRDFRHAHEFDYILAYGVYSWVPPEVRERLLALCGELLAPNGIACISYNAWPGRRPRHQLRELLLDRLRDCDDPARRIAEARRILSSLNTQESLAMARSSDDILFHDDLASVNDPATLEEFCTHAAAHGLQYLGEANRFGCDAFRQSVLCREGVALASDFTPAAMDRFHFSVRQAGPAIHGDSPVEAVLGALRDAYPLPLPFDELEPYAGGKEDLREILFNLVRAGGVDVHIHDFPCEETVTKRPRATRIARYQAARSRFVTSVVHCLVELTGADRKLIQRLDGTRKLHGPAVDWMARMGLLEG